MRAIHAVHRGEMWTERSLMARFFETEVSVPTTGDEQLPAPRELTAREQQILGVLSSGATNKDIARVLSISEKTVKGHLSSIFRKLRVSHRLEAALHAIQRGLR
jgi:two-component system, NarL family, response regulator DegU